MFSDCNDLLQSRHLREQAEYEYAMVRGVEGQSAFKASAPVLSQMTGHQAIDVVDKVRILVLYYLKGIPSIVNVGKEISPIFNKEQEHVIVKKARNGQSSIETDRSWMRRGLSCPHMIEGGNIVIYVLDGISYLEMTWVNYLLIFCQRDKTQGS
jgi:hypothetical protein